MAYVEINFFVLVITSVKSDVFCFISVGPMKTSVGFNNNVCWVWRQRMSGSTAPLPNRVQQQHLSGPRSICRVLQQWRLSGSTTTKSVAFIDNDCWDQQQHLSGSTTTTTFVGFNDNVYRVQGQHLINNKIYINNPYNYLVDLLHFSIT